MKNLVLNSLFLVSMIIFVDLLIMMVIGCTSSFFGLNVGFYDCTYCTIGKVVFFASFISLFVIVFSKYKSFSLK